MCASIYAKEHYARNPLPYKERSKKHKKEYYKRNIKFVSDYLKNHPCEICGEIDIVVLDFHHRNPEDKAFSIGAICSSGISVDRLQNEIEKCQVVCANCHRRITAAKEEWAKHVYQIESGG